MGRGSNGSVYIDIPPMPNTKLLASAFPTAAPARAVPNRADAMFVADQEGMISLTHNSSAATPSFTLLAWSDVAAFWIVYGTQSCAINAQVTWKVFVNTPIYIYASTSLTGAGAIVVLGGVTIQGNSPLITSGV